MVTSLSSTVQSSASFTSRFLGWPHHLSMIENFTKRRQHASDKERAFLSQGWCGKIVQAAEQASLLRAEEAVLKPANVVRRQCGGEGLSGREPRAGGLHARVQAGAGDHDGAARQGCSPGHRTHGGAMADASGLNCHSKLNHVLKLWSSCVKNMQIITSCTWSKSRRRLKQELLPAKANH